jgi:uncharacterized protein with NRDE domain
MCLIVFVHQPDSEYPLLVAANRDEAYDRPTEKLHFWIPRSCTNSDCDELTTMILAGKDLEEGGTWMGITKQGRFAAVTNFREPKKDEQEAATRCRNATWKSRGDLVADFLTSNLTPRQFLEGIHRDETKYYTGFNLLVGDTVSAIGGGLYFYSNRDKNENNQSLIGGQIQKLEPGRIYGLSNRFLDYPWPKLRLAKHEFKNALDKLQETESCPDTEASFKRDCFKFLRDTTKMADEELPHQETGCDVEFEKLSSSIFMESDWYGTRASSVLIVRAQGEKSPLCSLTERSFGPKGEFLGEVNITWGDGA